MKKFVTTSLFVVLTLAAVACGTNSNQTPAPTPTPTASVTPGPVVVDDSDDSSDDDLLVVDSGTLMLTAATPEECDQAFVNHFKKASYEHGLAADAFREMYKDMESCKMNLNGKPVVVKAAAPKSIEDKKATNTVVACASEKEMTRRMNVFKMFMKAYTNPKNSYFENRAALVEQYGAEFITQNGEKCELTKADGSKETIDIVAFVEKEKAAVLKN